MPADRLASGSMDLAQHLIDPRQTSIHDLLPGADCYRRDSAIGTITALGHRFDSWEILMVPVAITEEEKLLHSGTFLQADRVVAEELARGTDQLNVAIAQSHREPGPAPTGVLIYQA